MIGYVLLIAIAVVMSILVYVWIESYVPKDVSECPDDVSLSIQDVNCIENTLSLTLKNNGLFTVKLFYLRGSLNPDEEIATTNLLSSQHDGGFGSFPDGYLDPGNDVSLNYNINGPPRIYQLEIVPLINRTNEKGNEEFVSCGNARIKEKLTDCEFTAGGGAGEPGSSINCESSYPCGTDGRVGTDTLCFDGDLYGYFIKYTCHDVEEDGDYCSEENYIDILEVGGC